MANFDDDVPAGRQLNQDLAQLGAAHGQDYILMEAIFPPEYPNKPFFLRVITPRCRMYTGDHRNRSLTPTDDLCHEHDHDRALAVSRRLVLSCMLQVRHFMVAAALTTTCLLVIYGALQHFRLVTHADQAAAPCSIILKHMSHGDLVSYVLEA